LVTFRPPGLRLRWRKRNSHLPGYCPSLFCF